MTRILVVGAGAVGGYFGGRLAEAGRDVTFLVRTERAAQLRRDRLRIQSPHGDVTLEPKLVSAADIDRPYDLVLLGVKAYGLAAAIDDFAPAVGPDTAILPVLNGMAHLEVLVRRFGEGPVLGGVCRVATTVDGEGRIIQLAPFQQLAYGERGGGVSPRMEAVDAALTGAGFEAQLSTDIIQEMWEKWVFLASLGAATCLLRGSVGEIEAVSGGVETAAAVLDECVAIAAACGHPPGGTFVDRTRAGLVQKGSPMASSMYRDLGKGAPVEADHILGDLLARGRERGVAAPLLVAAYVNLAVYGQRLTNR